MSQRAFNFDGDNGSHLYAAFEAFHLENPHVYRLFCRFTAQAIARGHRHLSARMIWHRIRWETMIETGDPDGFKVNNNHSPYYARMWMREHPEHNGFFRTRCVKHGEPE